MEHAAILDLLVQALVADILEQAKQDQLANQVVVIAHRKHSARIPSGLRAMAARIWKQPAMTPAELGGAGRRL